MAVIFSQNSWKIFYTSRFMSWTTSFSAFPVLIVIRKRVFLTQTTKSQLFLTAWSAMWPSPANSWINTNCHTFFKGLG